MSAAPIDLLSPASEGMTDGSTTPVELSVAAGSGVAEVVLSRRKPAGMAPLRSRVEAGRVSFQVSLAPGGNLFTVHGLDGRGRKVMGPSFRVFRMSAAGASSHPPSPSTAPLPFLQPSPPAAPAERPAPPPPAPVRTYGKGRCGYPMFQTMSIPVVENGRTRYVEFKTDGNGCLPPEVELK